MFRRKTKLIKELREIIVEYNEKYDELHQKYLNLQNERDSLVVENNRLRSQIAHSDSLGRFCKK